MPYISVHQAAERLSVKPPAAYAMLTAGRLTNYGSSGAAVVSEADVLRLTNERRAEALRRRSDLCALAREIMVQLAPPVTDLHGRSSAIRINGLQLLHPDAFAVFGRDVLEAAAHREEIANSGGCVTCWARMSARVHQRPEPRDTAEYKILLGQPCPKDTTRWRTEAEAARTEMARRRTAETAKRQEAERARLSAEFSTAQQAAQTAVSRVRTIARQLAAVDPEIARQAGAQARRKHEQTAFTAQEQQRQTTARRNRDRLDWRP